MASKAPLKTTFSIDQVIRPLFTGGAVAIDNQARVLATTLGEDAVLTDPANSRHLASIEGDGESITVLTLTPSASHLIICSRSLSMRVYSLPKAENGAIEPFLLKTVKPHTSPIVVVAVDDTNTLVATGSADGVIKIWDIAGVYLTHTFRGPSGLISALHFFQVAGQALESKISKREEKKGNSAEAHPDASDANAYGKFYLASGHQDGKVKIWDLHKKACIAHLDSHVSDVQGLDYSPNERCLVTAGRDKTIVWWDARSWKIRRVVPCLALVEGAGFIDDGKLTYTADARGCLRLWDTNTGSELTPKQPPKSDEEGIVSAIYRPGIPFILCVQVDHTLALYEPLSVQSPAARSSQEPFRRISGTHDEIIDMGYLLRDHSMMALATNSEDIRIVSAQRASEDRADPWESSTSLPFGQDVALLRGHHEIVISLDVDWSGHWVATGAKDNTAKLWRIDPENQSFVCWATFSGHAESLGAVALPKTIPPETSSSWSEPLSHPPPFLITGSQDLTVKKWEVSRMPQTPATGDRKGQRASFTRKAHEKDINAVTVHPAGKLFASASQDKTVKIWSVQEGEVQGILRGHKRGVWSVQFSPSHLARLQGDEGAVAGKGFVLTGSGDKTIKIWSLADYGCVRTFEGHSNSVLKVAWLPVAAREGEDSKRPVMFASAAGDGLVKVWNANSGETECTLDNHEDRVWALAVHPETNTIVSGSGDSTVTFWRDTSAETQATASRAALETIQQEQELENYTNAGSYRVAISLALQLNHPGRLLALFTSVITKSDPEEGSLCGVRAVDEVLASLSDEQLFLLLLRLRDWNTNARTAPVAQRILVVLVRSYPASKFSGLSIQGARGQQSLREVLDALRVYTERHYKLMEELVDESYLVEYTLQEMDSMAPLITGNDVPMEDADEGITV